MDDLTAAPPSTSKRHGLFDDELAARQVPGSIHLANDEHIERLIARNGAVALVRQIAEDLALRDAQIVALRRKAEERERALRKVILECGLSNLDLETRLRTIEESKAKDTASALSSNGANDLEELLNTAINDATEGGAIHEQSERDGDATIRAIDQLRSIDQAGAPKGPTRGWKEYIWGSGTSRRSSRASSIHGEGPNGTTKPLAPHVVRAGGRRTVLQGDVFNPPESHSVPTTSRASSTQPGDQAQERKASLASLALKLVAGNPTSSRDGSSVASAEGASGTVRERSRGRSSTTSVKAPVLTKGSPQKIANRGPAGRRGTGASSNLSTANARAPAQERWDTMLVSPQNNASAAAENFGPVEMDMILPLEAQPPTLTTVYNNHYKSEFLTDRFGFIYDQRRKKRQKEAADAVPRMKRGSRYEMLSGNRNGISPTSEDLLIDDTATTRPDTPMSTDGAGDEGRTSRRWQDYLKLTSLSTELLSHTPLRSSDAVEVLDNEDGAKSPPITTEERGFVPATTTVAAPPVTIISENATISTAAAVPSGSAFSQEDLEPVKLLLQQLSEVHDSLQREKTTKWNEFLRKVRAERKREGEAAAAAAAENRSKHVSIIMPEAAFSDGEIIGISNLGVKGKLGRAKWTEFKSLVLGGIPVAFRAKIWAECSGAASLRVPGYYEDLVRQEDNDDAIIVSQIDMDVRRTLTDNIFFRRGPGVAKLREVLLAYARRNPAVGYCQGMNLITACLLLILPSAEDAFWVLTSMIEKILPEGYYDRNLLTSRADQQVLREYVASVLPKLSAHLDYLGIELEALTFQWFLSVFTDCLSAEALFRVWDVVLCMNDGSTFLFRVALALLKLNEKQLLECQAPASIYTYINHQMTNHAISIDGLIHASEALHRVVKREDIEAKRAKAIEAEKDLMRQREARNNLRKAERAAAASDAASTKSKVESVVTSTNGGETKAVVTEEDLMLTVRTPMPVDEEVQLSLG